MSKDKKESKQISPKKVYRLPGVNNDHIIPSEPVYIKENSYKPSKRKK